MRFACRLTATLKMSSVSGNDFEQSRMKGQKGTEMTGRTGRTSERSEC